MPELHLVFGCLYSARDHFAFALACIHETLAATHDCFIRDPLWGWLFHQRRSSRSKGLRGHSCDERAVLLRNLHVTVVSLHQLLLGSGSGSCLLEVSERDA